MEPIEIIALISGVGLLGAIGLTIYITKVVNSSDSDHCK